MKRLSIVVALVANTLVAQIKYPVTEKVNFDDNYFGTVIADPYRWLEDDRSEKTATWVKQQNEVTGNYLKAIPFRDQIRTRLTELWDYDKQSAPYKRGDYFFCYKNNGLQAQSVLFIKKTLEDEGTVLLDPNILSNDGTAALHGVSISNDGKTMAYGISRAGSDWVEICFRDITTRKDLPDTLKWVKFSGMSWLGRGIYYSRYQQPAGSALSQKNEFHQVYYHTLGTSQASDKLIFEDKAHPEYNFGTEVTEDERYLFIYTSESTSGQKLILKDLKDPQANFITISNDFDYEYGIIDNIGSTFYMLTNHKAPRYKVVSFTPQTASPAGWKTIIPESKSLLEGARICNGHLIVNYLEDVSSKLYCHDLNGKLERAIELPGLCRLGAFNTRKQDDFATYSIVQFTAPEQSYYLDTKTWKSRVIFSPNSKFASSNYVTEQVFYPSKDGTRIPMFITRRTDVKVGPSTPCFVYGYGGFNISLAPEFRIDRTIFLEAGGIYCVPNIRGGGEYGEDWHKAGTKCRKQNVFDDFIAACDYLVSKKYTSYDKIAIHGRSNGGLLIGAVMTQRPDICKVALPTVGVLDMLRFHQFTIGRAWSVDYGNSDNEEEFKCLVKYSPLHNLRPLKYPATMIFTGDHDDRVVPAHSFKFAATLQQQQMGVNPALIRIDVNAGHGAGKPTAKQIEEFTDMWAFVFYNLGITYTPATSTR